MPRVTYVGPHDAVDVPSVGQVAKNGEPIEVDDQTAKALLKQSDNWAARKPVDKES